MSARLSKWRSAILIALPILLLGTAWEIVGRKDSVFAFFFSFPSAIFNDLIVGIASDDLLIDVAYTLLPAIGGLLLGAVLGGTLGFGLISAPETSRRLSPMIAFLGAFPVFAIAPMTLIWFGLGLPAKLFLAFLGCVFIFLQAAHRGGMAVPTPLAEHFAVHGFTNSAEFRKLRLPFALDWLLSAFKTAANLALLGVFVGEFVASERGLARVMLNAGALYNVKRVLAAAILFTLVAVAMMAIADIIQAQRGRLLRWISVPPWVRIRKEG